MKRLSILFLIATQPAFAASGPNSNDPFFSLWNSNFVVLLAFLVFVAIVLRAKVPGMLGKLLDRRANLIRNDLEEARKLREDAQSILASYERKAREVQVQADQIVAAARRDAEAAAGKAREDLRHSIKRRLKAAEAQIASAEASALKEVRNRAVSIAVAAAGDVLGKQMSAADRSAMIDHSILEVETRLN